MSEICDDLILTQRCRKGGRPLQQRRMNQRMICSGSREGSVHSRACGEKRPRGSRTSTQRIGTTGFPLWHHTAVAEQNSITRSPSPYQPGTVTRRQRVLVRISTSERLGKRTPLVRGRPFVPGRRRGIGSERAASSRSRVMQITPRRDNAASRSKAAKPISVTSTSSRSGTHRRTCRII